MELLHDWFEIIADGGWNGGLLALATIMAVIFILSFITNKYFWAIIGIGVAIFLIVRYVI